MPLGNAPAPFNYNQAIAGGNQNALAQLQMINAQKQNALAQRQFSQQEQQANTDWLINASDQVIQKPSLLYSFVEEGKKKGVIDPNFSLSESPQKSIEDLRTLNQRLKLGRPQQAPKQTSDIKNYNFAKEQGYTRSFRDYQLEGKKAGATSVTTTIAGENAAGKKAGELGAQYIYDKRKEAEDAVALLQSNKEAIQLLNSGMVTGAGADWITGFGRALQQIGWNIGKDPVDNAQAYGAASAKRVASIIKAFGSGTGLSDADREYAEKAAAGNISMTETAIRRIIDINNRAATNSINYYNGIIKNTKKPVLDAFPFDPTLNVAEDLMNLKAETAQPSIDDLVKKYANPR